jgi:hypothetical protein
MTDLPSGLPAHGEELCSRVHPNRSHDEWRNWANHTDDDLWVNLDIPTLYLAIEHSDHFGSGTLYEKKFITKFCPRKGDRIVLFPHEGDLGDGPMGVVKEVYWHADGRVSMDLEHYVVDPSDQMERHTRGHTNSGPHAWYTERDGPLVEKLLANGWKKYGT